MGKAAPRKRFKTSPGYETATMARTYRPGVCNIGPRNRLARGTIGVVVLAATLWFWFGMEGLGLPRAVTFLLFVPLFVGFVSLYEAVLGFCVYQARRHAYDLR